MSLDLEKVIPPLPRIERGKPVVFGGDPKGTYLLYNNGNSVILRNLKNLSQNDIYTQHSGTVNVAKYSPSGFYIASADKFGKVRIWDTINPEHVLKHEYQPFAGPICDLQWTSDNQRIIVGGTGRSQFGAVFLAETGASVGEIMGSSKNINSVDFRPIRPYRAVAGNDEGLVTYFEGPPFQLKHSLKDHSRFVNVVRFCPTGSCFISAGADGKIFAYSAENGSTVGEVGNPAHTGGIYGIAFSKDGTRLLSVSADKSMKLWNVDGKNISFMSQYTFDNTVGNMLLGCCWVDDTIAVVTFSGSIHLFHAPPTITNLSEPRMVLCGHCLPITCALYSRVHNRLLTASSDGSVASWNLDSCLAVMVTGDHAHKTHIQSMAVVEDDLITVGFDDRCVLSSITRNSFIESVKLPSQPHCVGVDPERQTAIVACDRHIVLLSITNKSLKIMDEQELSCGACTLTVSPRTGTAIICTANDQLIVFKTCGGRLRKANVANSPRPSPILGAYSSDGSMVVFADAERTLSVHNVTDAEDEQTSPSLKVAVNEWWQNHTARITAIAWSPSNRRIATGSLDTSIVVWFIDSPKKTVTLRNAHPMSHSTALSWTDENTLVSTARDGSIRSWKLST